MAGYEIELITRVDGGRGLARIASAACKGFEDARTAADDSRSVAVPVDAVFVLMDRAERCSSPTHRMPTSKER
jgi:hypothetical protein